MFCYGQNMIMYASIEKNTAKDNLSPYDLYFLKIRPGYRDHSYKIEVIQMDSEGKEILLAKPEINVRLIIHKKDYKMPGSDKVEWDYETEVKSNDTYTGEILSIGDCSGKRDLSCSLRLKSGEKYTVRVYYNEKHYFEFRIDSSSEERIKMEYY